VRPFPRLPPLQLEKIAKKLALSETMRVTKPQLVVDSGPADDFVSIRCSSCDDFMVRIEGNTLSNKVLCVGCTIFISSNSTCKRMPRNDHTRYGALGFSEL
jgi:hypothetical protein